MQRAAAASVAIETRRPSWCSIVGAPRCGTTSLARYLGTHPDICFSSPKEPHFFSRREFEHVSEDELTDLVRQQYLHTFFPHVRDGAMLAEASVSYLYAPERMLPVLRMWPDAKFIVAVRNPLAMLPSLHLRHLHNGDETERDFSRAWALVEERRRGKHVPRSCIDARLLDYEEIGKLGKHVRRFLDVVGHERCFVSVFDDLLANPGQQYRRILDFLGLPDDLRTNFAVHRPSMRVKLGWLQRILKRPPRAILELVASDADLRRAGLLGNGRTGAARPVKVIRKHLLAWNGVIAEPSRLSAQLRRAMCASLREDVAELSATIGRDFSHWLVPTDLVPPFAARDLPDKNA